MEQAERLQKAIEFNKSYRASQETIDRLLKQNRELADLLVEKKVISKSERDEVLRDTDATISGL